MNPREISINDFTYDLPDDRIALHPLRQRDASKLLIFENEEIKEDVFSSIGNYLPEGSQLVFNNTKVINARISFFKSTGSRIEIFCLEPGETINEYNTVMSTTSSVKWKCFVGGASKWKEGFLEKKVKIGGDDILLRASRTGREGDAYIIQFSWEPSQYSFAAVLQAAGDVPLPPYIKRSAEQDDTSRYQTVYAEHEGSVAAPTAGLHFTNEVLSHLHKKNIVQTFVTLHVGAGTFKPVQADTMEGHDMHSEYIDVDIESILRLRNNLLIAAVGTTSLRTIETLYWLGVKAAINPDAGSLQLQQWDVYESPLAEKEMSAGDALDSLITWMNKKQLRSIFTRTQLLIVPGYRFRMAKMLVTNFHQPQSTLLLLVAAAIGDRWKELYRYAMEHDFRFLSYGDANLIFINENVGEHG